MAEIADPQACPNCGGSFYPCRSGDDGCEHCDTCCAVRKDGTVAYCGECRMCAEEMFWGERDA